jgi:HK97 family phage major capsid protein
MKKKSEIAFEAWKSATNAAKTKSEELTAKGAEATQAEADALNALIDDAAAKKAAYKNLQRLEAMQDDLDADEAGTGRKAKNNGGAPAIVGENSLGSRGLRLSNIFKAVQQSGGAIRHDVFKRVAPYEHDLSQRLKAAGYQPAHSGSFMFPLDADLIVEPVDEETGQKTSDYSELRREIKQALALNIDGGEFSSHMRTGFGEQGLKATFGNYKADMNFGDDAWGGSMVPGAAMGGVIDLFRAASVMSQAGATEIALPPQGSIEYPRFTSDLTFNYANPDRTTDSTREGPGTGVVRLSGKQLEGFVGIPNSLLRYSSPSAEMAIRAMMAAKAAQVSDQFGLEGVGTTLAPKGLINYDKSTAEIATTGRITLHVAATVGTNGNTLEPEDIADIMALYWEGKDPAKPTAWILRPMLFGRIRNRRADAVSANDKKGPFLFDVTRSVRDGIPDQIGGVKALQTVQATNNRIKGTGTNLHYLLFGNFAQSIHGMSGVMEIRVSEHALFFQDKTALQGIFRDDWGCAHEESFVFTDTLLQA